MVNSGLNYFLLLTPEEKEAAIRRMAADGMSDYTIAAATRLSVEFVRQVIGMSRSSGAAQ